MTAAQRWILAAAVALGIGYAWLSGAFVGVGSSPEPVAASAPAITPAGPVPTEPVAVPSTPDVSQAPQAQAPQAPSARQAPQAPQPPKQSTATFAAGCFWCTEADFDKVKGVISTISGYIGGRVPNPTYRQVSDGVTGHTEAVQIVYDPSVVTYEALLDHYWKNVDPFTANRQFCDIGSQYRPAIFVHDAAQRAAAEASKARVQQRFTQPVVVTISDASAFYPAEDYHQDYYQKNSAQYRFYRFGCGRDARLRSIWETS
jgi:peptide-methionine (S)-S-oxide reductase